MPLSRIIQESPGYGTNFLVSFMGHQTSPTNSFFFFQKNLFHSKISGAFLHIYISYFITYRDFLDFRIIKVNFDDSYFT